MEIKTAHDFRYEYCEPHHILENTYYSAEEVNKAMIEFAKYHVTLALQSAAKRPAINLFVRPDYKNSKYKKVENGESYNPLGTRQMWKVDKDSILNAYPLDNIV